MAKDGSKRFLIENGSGDLFDDEGFLAWAENLSNAIKPALDCQKQLKLAKSSADGHKQLNSSTAQNGSKWLKTVQQRKWQWWKWQQRSW